MFELHRNNLGQLVLHRPGRDDAVDVRVRRSFPWSNPTKFISVRSSDGKELLLIDDLEAIAPDLRKIIEDALTDGTFIPIIRRIDNIDVRFGFNQQEWSVQTDRGKATFRVQEREDVRFLGDGRFSIRDADGNIYELPRPEQLDEQSRRWLEQLV